MQATIEISATLKCSPLEMLGQDVDEIIMLINFCLRLGSETPEKINSKPNTKDGVVRIKVNDKTASGNWF